MDTHMSAINDGLRSAIEAAFPPRGQQPDMDPFDAWIHAITSMAEQRHFGGRSQVVGATPA